jgi:hypothetical protein
MLHRAGGISKADLLLAHTGGAREANGCIKPLPL